VRGQAPGRARVRGGRGPRREVGRAPQGLRHAEARGDGDGAGGHRVLPAEHRALDRKSTRLNSSHVAISYAVFCLKKKKKKRECKCSFRRQDGSHTCCGGWLNGSSTIANGAGRGSKPMH